MARNKALAERDRLIASLSDTLPSPGGVYEISSALVEPERRRLLGSWTVVEHLVDGQPWLEGFARANLGGASLEEGRSEASYDFRERLCVKRVAVTGRLELSGGQAEYSWRMTMAIAWEPSRGSMRVRPELGYQATSLGGEPAAVREFDAPPSWSEIRYHFEGERLVLEEGGDRKLLERKAQ